MKKLVVGMIVLSALMAAVGCNKKDEAAASGGATGVAECDEYITKYTACIGKMPAASKATVEQGLKTQTDAWKAAAATPEGKSALKTSCKATLEALASNPMCK